MPRLLERSESSDCRRWSRWLCGVHGWWALCFLEASSVRGDVNPKCQSFVINNNPMTLLNKLSVTDPIWLAAFSFLKTCYSFSWVQHDSLPALQGTNQLEWFSLEMGKATLDGGGMVACEAAGLAPGITVAVSNVTFWRNWILPGICPKGIWFHVTCVFFCVSLSGSLSLCWSRIDTLLISGDWQQPWMGKNSVVCVGVFSKRPCEGHSRASYE